jgi:flagellar biosynthetic protein FlhB
LAVEDRTEAATPRRREEAREEGRVAKSADINSAVVLLMSLLLLRIAGPYMFQGLSSIAKDTFSNLHNHELRIERLPALCLSYMMRCAWLCLPIMAGAGAIGLASNVLQVGFRITPKAIAPDLSRLDPIKGLARVVSWRSLVELGKSLLKITIVAYFVYSFLRNEYPALADLSGMLPAEMGRSIATLCWRLLARGCAAMLVIGILDYIYQRLSFESSLRMTKQEVKDEFKRTEGDPHVKGRIRQRQREMARRRMIHDVARADVVVTNPTHIAVALQYDAEKMAAPTVVAKGQRLLAERIKEAAEAHRVPIVENPPVARLLYKTVEVGDQIPPELYQAVAEILAYVYQLNEGIRGRRSQAA